MEKNLILNCEVEKDIIERIRNYFFYNLLFWSPLIRIYE